MRPLGYWIKEIDRRLEANVNRLLADEQLTRRHWQILTTLAQHDTGTAAAAALDAALAPFAPTVRPDLDDLISRGWVTPAPNTIATGMVAETVALTVAGRAAHDRVAARVRTFRAHVSDGLSAEDYATLIALLERVAGNLTPA